MEAQESVILPKNWDPETLVSPRDIAGAIGASESSLRRWIDNGDIRVSRTVGGHRRVTLRDATQFIRKIGAVVVRPELIHLPNTTAIQDHATDSSKNEDLLYSALVEGNRQLAGGLVVSWYLQGQTLQELFDHELRGALYRMGDLWKHNDRGILVEHRATDICLGIINTLRSLLPTTPDSAPLAIGAAPEGDPYLVPSLMVSTVLAEAGMRVFNYGANTPIELLGSEALQTGAKLVWVSISAVDDVRKLSNQVKKLAAKMSENQIKLVIGGHASGELAIRNMPNIYAMRSMSELAAFGRELMTSLKTK